MTRNSIGGSILIVATLARCATQASATSVAIPGPSGSNGGVLAPSASPYAILAPSTLENTPGGQGWAAFQGRPFLCHSGFHEAATNSGVRCVPTR